MFYFGELVFIILNVILTIYDARKIVYIFCVLDTKGKNPDNHH